MNTFILYFILANIGLAAFYLFFRLFLHKDTFFREKRVALLLGMLFALAYPLVDVSGWMEHSEKVAVLAKNIRANLPEIRVDSKVVGKQIATAWVLSESIDTKSVGAINSSTIANSLPSSTPSVISRATSLVLTLSWFDWALLIYVLVAGVLLFRILHQLTKMLQWMRRSERFEWNGERLYRLPKGSTPFSFFRAVFVNPEAYSESDLEEILQHERAHGKQGHTYDVLFGELVCVLCWVNPFTWLLKRRIRENIEFLADQDVLHKGFDPKTYQYHLLQLSCQRSDANLANHFNVSQLKKRIVMMNKKRTSWAGLSKYALTLPLFAALLLTAYAWGQQTETKAKALIAQATSTSKLVPVQSKKPTIKTTTPAAPVVSKIEIKQTVYPAPTAYQGSTNRTLMVQHKPDKPAEFPGGFNTFAAFLRNYLKFPYEALVKGEQGWLNVEVIINEYGFLMDYKFLNPSPNRIFVVEFGRVVEEARKIIWKPAEKEGKNVAISFVLPLVFRFEGEHPVNESSLTNCITVTAKRNRLAEKEYKNRKYKVNAEVMPQFPGGHAALFAYLEKELRNPQSGKDGIIPVSFVVEKTGVIDQVVVPQPEVYDPIYLAEAIRVVKAMPAWSPGVNKGEKVAINLVLPILFYPHLDIDNTQKVELLSNKNSPNLVVFNGRPVKTDIKSINSDTMKSKNWADLLHLERKNFTYWKTSFIKSGIPILVNADQPYVHDVIVISANQ